MAFSPDAVANRFLDLAWKSHGERGHDVSPMKIQKLVYYAHGWCLALTGKPLIRENVQAWMWGPVIRSLYSEFKAFGNSPINEYAREMSCNVMESGVIDIDWASPTTELEGNPDSKPSTDQANAIIDRVWKVYGALTPVQLSNMTHEEGEPWRIIADKFKGEVPLGVSIPDALIRDRFRLKLLKN